MGSQKYNQGFGQAFLQKYFVPSPDEKEIKPAPLYITVGPPCAGKTEALTLQLEQDGYDPDSVLSSQEVALDEQTDVYQRVPLAAFIFPTTRLDPKLGAKVLQSGKTVSDRLLDPSPPPLDKTDIELRNVILRVAGRITPQEFADRSREQALQAGDTVKFFRNRRKEVTEDLIQAVEHVSVQAVGEVLFQMQLKMEQMDADIEDENELPYDEEHPTKQTEETTTPKLDLTTINATSAHLLSARALIRTPFVDLFVPHAIFCGGIDRAEDKLLHLLESLSSSHPVCWGNTNTRPVEYVVALKAAQRAGRPVQFVAWGKTPHMPRVPRRELLRRTVSKFRATGRYIPAGAVAAALGRVERLMREAEKEAAKLTAVATGDVNEETSGARLPEIDSDEEWAQADIQRINVALAALAGFSMDEAGYVIRVAEPTNFNQKASRPTGRKKNGQRNNKRKTQNQKSKDATS